MNQKLLHAIACKNTSSCPIWLMRQAGRYLADYQKLKKKYTLLQMFHDVNLVVEVTKLPFKVLPLDAAILFSDILTILNGFGKKWSFQEGLGPLIEAPLQQGELLIRKDPFECYAHIHEAIKLLKKDLDVPLLGFAGAPFTIACYLIEGKTSKDQQKTKKWLFSDPISFHRLLHEITLATIDYLDLQIDAGVDAIQIFDSWANALGVEEFKIYCVPYQKLIVKHVKERGIPIIVFCRGSCLFAEEIASYEPNVISLDWSGSLPKIRQQISPTIALQGNLDPSLLFSDRSTIQKALDRLLIPMKNDPGYIFNLGHGILPHTPLENVQFLVDYVRSYS